MPVSAYRYYDDLVPLRGFRCLDTEYAEDLLECLPSSIEFVAVNFTLKHAAFRRRSNVVRHMPWTRLCTHFVATYPHLSTIHIALVHTGSETHGKPWTTRLRNLVATLATGYRVSDGEFPAFTQ